LGRIDEDIAGGLEEICKRRAVWGSGIYTDDSDVVAAAIHSGWIMGDFSDSNEDLRRLFDHADHEADVPIDDQMSFKEKPSHPIRIPTELDMHVTILVLPPLQKYTSSVMNNLHSRAWGEDHDGMSFKIHAIDFVDEPRYTRYIERSGAARKQRMRDEQNASREAAETLLGLLSGGGRSVPIGA